MAVASKYVPIQSSMGTKIENGEVDKSKLANATSNDVFVGSVITPKNGVGSSSTSLVKLSDATLGGYLARRLVQIGVADVFSVPGDSNMVLLDHLISEPGLTNIGCCNELNAG